MSRSTVDWVRKVTVECEPYKSIDRFDQAALRLKINKFYTFLLVLFDFLSFKIFNCKYHFIIDITISKKLQKH